MTLIILDLSVSAVLCFIALYIVFGKLHTPEGRWKKIAAYALMFFGYPLASSIVWFAHQYTLANILWLASFLLIALLCRKEGDRTRPIISAFYIGSMFVVIAMITGSYAFVLDGIAAFLGSLASIIRYINFILQVLWAVFYYFVSRKMNTNMPLSFSILIVCMPLAVVIIGLSIVSDIRPVLEDKSWQEAAAQSNLFLYSGIFCTLILIFNVCAYYLYVKLAVAHESLRFTQNLANTPPVWTAEAGLSTLFIEKYQITTRERQVIEILLLGKTDKEIANELDLAVNTIQAHLKRVYKKTGAAGRFALATLVRGE